MSRSPIEVAPGMFASTVCLDHDPAAVLSFWFDFIEPRDLDNVDYIERMMKIWFGGQSTQFDQVQKANAELVHFVGKAELNDEKWTNTPEGMLARVLLLDQFSRCIYRGTAAAFQYDTLTAQIISSLLDRDWIVSKYAPIQRLFLGVSIQHSEDISMQQKGLDIARMVPEGASDAIVEFVGNLKGYPREHYDVIAQFGRFPSRNAALGRANTAEEEAWLQSPDIPAWAKSQLPAAATTATTATTIATTTATSTEAKD